MNPKKSHARERFSLQPHQLRHRIDPRSLPLPKAYLRHRTHIIGQDRAIVALELGLRLESPGYNIFVSGPSGIGRMTTARHILKTFKQPRCPLHDYVYVHNFQEPDRAQLLVLEPGQGRRLKKAVDTLIGNLKRELPRALTTEVCQKERDRILAEYQKREHELVSIFQEKIRTVSFTVVELQGGPVVEHDVLPVINGEPQTMAALEEMVAKGTLTKRRHQALERKHQKLRSELEQIQRRTRSLVREMNGVLEDFERRIGSAVIDTLIGELRDQFQDEAVIDYVDGMREALLERIPRLVRQHEDDARPGGDMQPAGGQPPSDPLAPFQVNVILSNARRKDCPVVFEHSPTLVRLFGTIERSIEDAFQTESDFMNIRAGSLLRADGGFFVVNAEDVLTEPGVWKGLKRTLSAGQLEVRAPEGPMAMMPSALKPDPIPLNVKIIMLGDEDLYRVLFLTEDDFKKTFKVKAEFDVEMEFSDPNIERFMAFIARVVNEENLLPPIRPAIALLVEEAMRDVEDQEKLSTRFRVVADLLREATYWAKKADRRRVMPADVQMALSERYKRFNLSEEKYRESIERDIIMVETSGGRIGQVNGLAVFDLGDYSFGKPSRITASVGPGRHGVVNIERESGLSGEIHDKGVFILTGFLRNRFGRHNPLALEASVCFEQSYGEIDGDSASSTEVYAVLSALAEVPLEQGIAVTGSISQQGDIQPIGGINQKIEGFFDLCLARGLNGSQGVLIPRANLVNLMLKSEVIEAVREHMFNIWAISTVDEGIEILTGIQAGTPNASGVFPSGTVNRKVSDRLIAMAQTLREYR
jgi:predicted ATP-dependent protease